MQTARQRLAHAQADLVRALVAQGPIPERFDEARVRAAARSLVNKRRSNVARAWPKLVESVGEMYVESFTQYASANPLPACACPRADGRAFLRWLESRQPLSDAACIEALSFDLRFTVTPTGLRPRRFALTSAVLRDAAVRVIAARLPWLGERWWRMPRRR